VRVYLDADVIVSALPGARSDANSAVRQGAM
jgi:hypothetical protein